MLGNNMTDKLCPEGIPKPKKVPEENEDIPTMIANFYLVRTPKYP
jgi:hypothetical protein